MKKLLFMLLMAMFCCWVSAQAYRTINIAEPEYNTYDSYSGIDIQSITPQTDGSYEVTFFNTNYNQSGSRDTYNFTWYLSYNGKRVSDYFQMTIGTRRTVTKTVRTWSNAVPASYRNYVTAQFGKEPAKKDRRDND